MSKPLFPHPSRLAALVGVFAANVLATEPQTSFSAYQERVEAVRAVPGLAAFWDFVQRQNGAGGNGNFVAQTDVKGERLFPLIPHNISVDFWSDGEAATLADFPLMGRGPFGQAVQIKEPKRENDLPVLQVERADLHDSRIDVKGPGKSVSMVVWLIFQGNNHAIAGLWHEGTDTPRSVPPQLRVRGQRQYGMFAGLWANGGSASVHVSENGLGSFGDIYARHLAVTADKMLKAPAPTTPETLDSSWTTIGFVYDNTAKTVTAYNSGQALENWVENPAQSKFYGAAEKAWRQGWLARVPGMQEGEDAGYPKDQFYLPPEDKPLSEVLESATAEERVILRSYAFTKVRERLRKDAAGQWVVADRELAVLKTNPWFFGHDLYAPASAQEGGPFTIGRVIHSNRHGTLDAWIGGVAVYDRALKVDEMAALSRIGTGEGSSVIHHDQIIKASGQLPAVR